MSQENSLQYQDILAALKNHAHSSVFAIYVPSLKRSVAFRQITVEEQKFISKRSIEDGSNKKNTYETFVALIARLCVDKTLKVADLTELDRIKILIELFRKNYNIDKYSVTCPECSHEFTATIDFGTILEEFDNFDLTEFIHEVESESSKCKYAFHMLPPTIKRIREYNAHCAENKSEAEVEPFERSDFYKTFIVGIDVMPQDELQPKIAIDATQFNFAQFDELLGNMPVDAIFSEKGMVGALVSKYINKIANIKSDISCPNCGHKIEGAVSPTSFFQ
jgi:hypothetical protein